MDAKPNLEDWLDALNGLPNLKNLSLQHATTLALPTSQLASIFTHRHSSLGVATWMIDRMKTRMGLGDK
jgi:hypothetical protein